MCLIYKLLKLCKSTAIFSAMIINMIQNNFPNKLARQLLGLSPNNFIFSNDFKSQFSYIKAWFTDQNSKSAQRERR